MPKRTDWGTGEVERLRSAVVAYGQSGWTPHSGSAESEETSQAWKAIAAAVGGVRDVRKCKMKWESLNKVKREFTREDDAEILLRKELGQGVAQIAREAFPGSTGQDVNNRLRSPQFTGRPNAEDGSGGGGGFAPRRAHSAEESAALAGDDNARAARAEDRLFSGAGAEGWRAYPRDVSGGYVYVSPKGERFTSQVEACAAAKRLGSRAWSAYEAAEAEAKEKAAKEAEAKAEAAAAKPEAEAKAAAAWNLGFAAVEDTATVARSMKKAAEAKRLATRTAEERQRDEAEHLRLARLTQAGLDREQKEAKVQVAHVERCRELLLQVQKGGECGEAEETLRTMMDERRPTASGEPGLLYRWGGDERKVAKALLEERVVALMAAEFGRTEQRLLGLLATPGAAPDEISRCTQQMLTDTRSTLVARYLGLVGSDSALPAYYAGDGFPRELAERRRELLLAVVDHACARVAAHDGEAPISPGRLMSLEALRQLLASPDLPKYALHHGLGRLRHSESEANLKAIYESLNFPYTPRLVSGHPFPPSASDIFLQQPSPLYTLLMEPLNPLSIANQSRLEAAMRMLLIDFQPSSIAPGTEHRRSGSRSVIVGMRQARQLRDAEYAAFLDMEFMTPEKGWLSPITGGGKRWHDASLRLVRLDTNETVHSLSRKKPKDEGLDARDIEPFERRVKKYMKAGYKIYSFSKSADSRFITYCAGLEPHEYDRVAVDFRAVLGSLTTFFLDTGAPNSMDIARDTMGLPGTAEWELADRARIEGLLHTAGAGVPHTAPMDTWQLAFPGCMVHKLLNDRSLPISQLLAAP